MKALSNPETPFTFNITGPNSVLLVDDDDDAILLIQLLLKRAQVSAPVHITTDGEQAVAYFQSRLANPAELLPSIVFLDLRLPRQSGFEVLKWIRAQPGLKDVPVLIMSSSNRLTDMETAKALGADFYCEKYPALEDLIALFAGKTFFPPIPTLDFG
ncbi:response regulator [Rariglobus hedericola]|uniref:Response regulator n=1 Tax=Rariglobus hedericola TaxID=2597822 RepID=A0A556QLB4_9BACT|nr:response regulator [Rariglobus hedericola]TSJ77418.1 response regulator [Rariglobus hedericola]